MKYIDPTALAISTFLFIGGVWLLGYECTALQQASASSEWQETSGVIVHSEVEIIRGKRGRSRARADIEYEYDANGSRKLNDTVNFGAISILAFTSHEAAEEIVYRYQEGDSVTVFFNPDSPGEAVLERELPNSAYFGFFLGSVLLLAIPVALFVACPHGPIKKMLVDTDPHGYRDQDPDDAVAAWKQKSGYSV